MTNSTSKTKTLRFSLLYFTGVALVVALLVQLAPASPPTTTIPEALPSTSTSTSTPSIGVTVPTFLGDEPIADAAEKILPSVVHIQTSTGVGSGVIYSSDGLIITAAHVVGSDENVWVRLANGTQVRGTVLGAVAEVDVAVVRIDRSGLAAATFSEEKPRVGQLAIAVGSPWGLASTVTAGIVSAVDQTNCGNEGFCLAFVQTDAAINPGNSGGALINRAGEVVGINVSIITASGANDGVGFAVPTTTVLAYAEAIITGEPLQTAFLGVSIDNATGDRAGAVITAVHPGSGAETGGLQEGDIIVAIAGVPVVDNRDLVAQVRTHRPGATIDLVVVRGDQEITVTVTLGVRSEDL